MKPRIALPVASSGVNHHSSVSEKISLFRSLFRGREDVYPRRFESLALKVSKNLGIERFRRRLSDWTGVELRDAFDKSRPWSQHAMDRLTRHDHFRHIQGEILFAAQERDDLIAGPRNCVAIRRMMKLCSIAQCLPNSSRNIETGPIEEDEGKLKIQQWPAWVDGIGLQQVAVGHT